MPLTFKKLIKHLDAFGQPVSLMYKGSTRYKTIFGGSLTILLTVIFLLLSLQSINRLIYREKIFSSTSTISSFDPLELEIPFQEGFYLALGYNPDGLNNFTHRPFDIIVEQKKYKRDPNGTRYLFREKKFSLEPCEAEHFPKGYDYIKAGHKNWMCFPRNSTITLKGQYESDEFEYVKISINKCRNSSVNNYTCMDQARFLNITKELQEGNFYFKLAISSHIFNLQNFKEPYFMYMETSAFFLVNPSNSYKSADVFIKQNTVITDYDLVYENPATRYLTSFFNYREQSVGPVGDTYAAVFLRGALERSVHLGAAEKFSVILSNFGGLLSTIFALFFFVLKYFNRKRLMISLSNLLYHFDFNDEKSSFTNLEVQTENQVAPPNQALTQEDQPHDSQINTIQAHSFKNYDSYLEVPARNPVKESKNPRLIECLGNNLKDELNEMPEQIEKATVQMDTVKATVQMETSKKIDKDSFLKNITSYLGRFKKLGISSLTIICSLLCCKRNLKITKEGRLARKAFKKIGRDMDIIQVLQKVKEVEKLKDFLFNQKQKVFFEFFPKEVVKLKSESNKKAVLGRRSDSNSLNKLLNKLKRKIHNDFLRKVASKHLSYLQTGPISVYLELYHEYNDLSKHEEESRETSKLISMLGEDIIRILNTSTV